MTPFILSEKLLVLVSALLALESDFLPVIIGFILPIPLDGGTE